MITLFTNSTGLILLNELDDYIGSFFVSIIKNPKGINVIKTSS